MSLEFKRMVVEANKELPRRSLVKYSWGNVSGFDNDQRVIVIKPVGIPYDQLTVDNVSVVDINGKKIDGENNPLEPSVDLDIHLALYQNFPECKAIVHTHSTYATILAQLKRSLPCYGTTHADYFAGTIPCVHELSAEEISGRYEWNTGMAIVDHFKKNQIDPMEVPAAFSPCHGPFTWGSDVWDAVHKAVVLEEICKMAVHMLSITSDLKPFDTDLLNKHFYRKHGPTAYFTNDDHGNGMITR